MAFVNEYISEENIKKYGIIELFAKHHIKHREGYPYSWTFDEERECYYTILYGGGRDFPNEATGVLYYKGIGFKVTIVLLDESSANYSFDPYVIVWGLVKITPECTNTISSEEIISVLKEALTCFGDDGVSSFEGIKNLIVKFKF